MPRSTGRRAAGPMIDNRYSKMAQDYRTRGMRSDRMIDQIFAKGYGDCQFDTLHYSVMHRKGAICSACPQNNAWTTS